MERFGGVRNPRSGARWDRRNDGRTATELVEFKRTDNRRSITLKLADLIALERHALAESRRPVLGFQLGGRNFVVLPEREYFELADRGRGHGPAAGPRTLPARLVPSGQVSGRGAGPVLRRSSTQRSGAGSQERVPGDPPRSPRSVPGPGPMLRVRPRQRREVGSLGRVFRKRAPQDQEAASS